MHKQNKRQVASGIFSITHSPHNSWVKRTWYELDPGLLGHAHTQLKLISDGFPLPQSPTTVHPERIVDASVRCSIPEWKGETNGSSLGGRVGAIVVKASESELVAFVHRAHRLGSVSAWRAGL
jgi:hypothetical protein